MTGKVGLMSELAIGFQSLPAKYQSFILHARERLNLIGDFILKLDQALARKNDASR
jgi:hypothetical protein